MADQFYVGRDNNKFGPFSALQLREMAGSGKLLPVDTVWKEGMEKPVLASRVKNLFSQPHPAPPEEVAPQVTAPPIDAPAIPAAPEASSVQPVSTPPVTVSPARKPDVVRKRRAIAVKGATIANQDGVTVYYRKKCIKCGHEDTARSSMRIELGTNRAHFFCTKCRKNHDVQLQGMME